MMDEKIGMNTPRLFGIKHSNRDFSKKESWSKNKFNSAFPAALIAYMGHKGIKPIYLKLNKTGQLSKDYISAESLFGADPLSKNLH